MTCVFESAMNRAMNKSLGGISSCSGEVCIDIYDDVFDRAIKRSINNLLKEENDLLQRSYEMRMLG